MRITIFYFLVIERTRAYLFINIDPSASYWQVIYVHAIVVYDLIAPLDGHHTLLVRLAVLICYWSPYCTSSASGWFLMLLGSQFGGSEIQVQSVPSVSRRKLGNKGHLPTNVINAFITHLIALLIGLIVILVVSIIISPAESSIWGLPPCRQVVTFFLFSCICLVLHRESAVEFKGNYVWSWDRCCWVISFPFKFYQYVISFSSWNTRIQNGHIRDREKMIIFVLISEPENEDNKSQFRLDAQDWRRLFSQSLLEAID